MKEGFHLRVIFLDIDGVLNNSASKSHCGVYVGIDNDKVKRLKRIVDATDAKIVLSSTWRLGFNKNGNMLEHHITYMNRKFRECDLSVFDVTPDLGRNGAFRGTEIKTWLDDHPDVESWIVIDDEEFPDFHKTRIIEHWIETTYKGREGGLQEEHVSAAIDMLR